MKNFIIPREEFQDRKFIQLYLNDSRKTPIFRYAPDEITIRHEVILSNLIKELGFKFEFEKMKGLLYGLICTKTCDYNFVGAGLCSFIDNELRIEASSQSMEYEIRPNKEHLVQIAQLYPKIKFEMN